MEVSSWFAGEAGSNVCFDPQENIIREFNLNELYQKSKKLSRSREKPSQSQFPTVPEEEEPEQQGAPAQGEEPESKKDK